MSKSISGNLYIILSGLILLSFSCTPGSCLEDTESFLKASFYDDETKLLRAPDSLTIYGLGMDTIILYDNAKNVQPALFPLNPSTDHCSFIIIVNGVTDTLVFRYSSYPHLISKECGYTFYYNVEQPDPTANAIKGIYLNKSNITTVNEENIRIFY
jgi:hypothetical protein